MSRFDTTIKKMQDIMSDIKKASDNKAEGKDEETVLKIKTISDKTIDTINEASVKLKEVVGKISDEKELDDFLSRVEDKCKQTADYALKKLDEIVPIEEKTEYVKINDVDDKLPTEKLIENDNVKNAAKMATDIKDEIIDFINSPETQEKIKNVKLSALNVADKGLDAILKLLGEDKDK